MIIVFKQIINTQNEFNFMKRKILLGFSKMRFMKNNKLFRKSEFWSPFGQIMSLFRLNNVKKTMVNINVTLSKPTLS